MGKKLKTKLVILMPNGTNDAYVITDKNLKEAEKGQQLASTPRGEYIIDGKSHRYTTEFRFGRWVHYMTYYYVYNHVKPINFEEDTRVVEVEDGIRPEILRPIFDAWYLKESRPSGDGMTEQMKRLLTYVQLGLTAYTLYVVLQLQGVSAMP